MLSAALFALLILSTFQSHLNAFDGLNLLRYHTNTRQTLPVLTFRYLRMYVIGLWLYLCYVAVEHQFGLSVSINRIVTRSHALVSECCVCVWSSALLRLKVGPDYFLMAGLRLGRACVRRVRRCSVLVLRAHCTGQSGACRYRVM